MLLTTEEDQSALDKLYPSMKQAQPAKPADPSQPVETEAQQVVNQARDEGKAAQLSEEQLGAASYGSRVPGAGDPLPDYGRVMGGFFDAKEIEARGIDDTDELEVIAEARTAINDAFLEYSVGGNEASQLMAAAREYDNNPRDAASLAALRASTFETLRREYGSQTQKMIEGAKRLTDELCRKIPNLSRLVDSGLGDDPVFTRSLIFAAKRKGLIK